MSKFDVSPELKAFMTEVWRSAASGGRPVTLQTAADYLFHMDDRKLQGLADGAAGSSVDKLMRELNSMTVKIGAHASLRDNIDWNGPDPDKPRSIITEGMSEAALQDFRELAEKRIAECSDPNNAPFPMDEKEATIYLRGKRDALQWALEMLPAPPSAEPSSMKP